MPSKPITIGHLAGESRQPLHLDVAKLLDTRMLVQANSGGGKSWLLRLLAEKLAPSVPTIIIDLEGEFATLREKIDLVLVGQGGELPADVRAAGLLARRLVELRVSAVLDLYELKMHDRRRFVRTFLDGLMNLPKSLWQPTLIVLDEAHVFCPERSAGDAESTDAVIDLASRGRKRGYCCVLATQRLSKLHKDAAAECNNVAIGRTTLDVDVKRSLDLLGMTAAGKDALRDLAAGEFLAFGPALDCNGVVRFASAKVETTHPKSGGKRAIAPPGPSRRIKSVVGELADLAREAEEEIRTLAQAQAEIAKLTRELKVAQKVDRSSPAPAVSAAAVEKAVSARDAMWRKLSADNDKKISAFRKRLGKFSDDLLSLTNTLSDLQMDASGFLAVAPPSALSSAPAVVPGHDAGTASPPPSRAAATASNGDAVQSPYHRGVPAKPLFDRKGNFNYAPKDSASPEYDLNPTERAQLRAFFWLQDEKATPAKIAFYADRSVTSSAFDRGLATLRRLGLVDGWQITDAGRLALPISNPKPTGNELRRWLADALNPTENAILDSLISAYPKRLGNEAIANASQRSHTSSAFDRALARLRSIEAIEGTAATGGVKAADVFFTT